MEYPQSSSFTIKLLAILLSCLFLWYHIYQEKHILNLILKESALCCRKEKRVKWSEINQHISNRHFRRMFCMDRELFKLLYRKIISHTGDRKFKSEEYIDAFLDIPYDVYNSREIIMHRVHAETSGGYICGEVKLAITLRLLAGGNSLHLGALFDVST